jgi:copper(I)-binding protein
VLEVSHRSCRRRSVLALALLLVFSGVVAHAHEIKLGDLTIVHPMADTAKRGQGSAKGSVKIRNEGTSREELNSIRAGFAEEVKILAPVPVSIPPDGQAVSVPVAFMNIKQELYEDAAYEGQLVFENAGSIQVDFMAHSHSH